MDSHLKEVRLDGEVAYDGKFLKVSRDRIQLPDGSISHREYIRHPGAVVILPDNVTETFAPETEPGGEDAPDGRGLRYLQWTWDPDPSDTTLKVPTDSDPATSTRA